MRSCSTGAIVLRTRPFREADLLLTCLTPELGKLTGVAAHARRSQRRFGGALEMGTIGDLQYTEQAHRDLVRVEEVRVEWTPLGVPSPLVHFAALGVMLDMAEATTVERQPGAEKFRLLREAILHLHEAPQQMLLQWCVQWFAVLGVAPILDRCLRCHAPCDTAAAVTFIPSEGGILCPHCGRGGGLAIALDAASCLHWQQLAAGEQGHWAPARSHHRALPDAVWQYCHHVTGRKLTSGQYWDMVWGETADRD